MWIDGNAQAGFRSHLENEFSSINVFNLRGNQRTSGELSRREGGKVFGSGSRTPISVTLLVKKPNQKTEKAAINYYDIGDYLSREKKLEMIKGFSSIRNIDWVTLTPDKHNDWINFRNDIFSSFIPIGDKKEETHNTYFASRYSRGIATARDQFCWNYSESLSTKNINTIIDFYNEQRRAYHVAKEKDDKLKLESFVTYDSTKITWNRGFKQDLERGMEFNFSAENIYKVFIDRSANNTYILRKS